MAIAIDQMWAFAQGTAVTSQLTTFQTGAAAALLVCLINSTHTPSAVTDGNGDTFTIISCPADAGGNQLSMAYCPNSVGGSIRFNVAFGGLSTNCCIAGVSFAGIAHTTPLDRTVSTQGVATGGNVPSGTTPTTRQANEVLISLGEQNLSTVQTFTKDAAYTIITGVNNSNGPSGKTIFGQYRIVSATGAYSNTFTSTSSTNNASNFLATFSDTDISGGGGGGGSGAKLLMLTGAG
jgi:hypothetical protein